MTHVLIVDDHPIVHQGCRRILEDMGVGTISHATTVVSGYRVFLRSWPHVVVTDLSFSGDDLGGLALIQRISKSRDDVKVLVFSMHNDAAIITRALTDGASGYVLKDAPSDELAEAMRMLLGGMDYLSHELAIKVAMMRVAGDRSPLTDLTERELQILARLAVGDNNDQIAAKLKISSKTVGNSTALIRSKLKLDSFADLLRFAIRHRLSLS